VKDPGEGRDVDPWSTGKKKKKKTSPALTEKEMDVGVTKEALGAEALQ